MLFFPHNRIQICKSRGARGGFFYVLGKRPTTTSITKCPSANSSCSLSGVFSDGELTEHKTNSVKDARALQTFSKGNRGRSSNKPTPARMLVLAFKLLFKGIMIIIIKILLSPCFPLIILMPFLLLGEKRFPLDFSISHPVGFWPFTKFSEHESGEFCCEGSLVEINEISKMCTTHSVHLEPHDPFLYKYFGL